MKWYKVQSKVTRDIYYYGISLSEAEKTMHEIVRKNQFEFISMKIIGD